MIEYAFFDLDGTLADSMPMWKALPHKILALFNQTPDEALLKRLSTLSLEAGCEFMRSHFSLDVTKELLISQVKALIIDEYRVNIQLKNGVCDYLEQLKSRGIRMAVLTAGSLELASLFLNRTGIARYFEFVQTCDEVGIGKDNPEFFLVSARRIGMKPENIAVYEDVIHALQTAKSVGFQTFAVYDNQSSDDWAVIRGISDFAMIDFSILAGE